MERECPALASRGFPSSHASLPLIGGGVALVGGPTAVAVPAAAEPNPDAKLIEFADLDRRIEALCTAHRGMDYEDMPGCEELEQQRSATLAAIGSTQAASLLGCIAKARIVRTKGVENDADNFHAIVGSLADDLLSLTA